MNGLWSSGIPWPEGRAPTGPRSEYESGGRRTGQRGREPSWGAAGGGGSAAGPVRGRVGLQRTGEVCAVADVVRGLETAVREAWVVVGAEADLATVGTTAERPLDEAMGTGLATQVVELRAWRCERRGNTVMYQNGRTPQEEGGCPPPHRPIDCFLIRSHPPIDPPLLPFQCLRLTAKILPRRLRCQEDLSFKIFRPAFGGDHRGTLGGGGGGGGPSQPPLPPPPF